MTFLEILCEAVSAVQIWSPEEFFQATYSRANKDVYKRIKYLHPSEAEHETHFVILNGKKS